MKLLRRTQFGNPILRAPALRLSKAEILSAETQDLIANMYHTLEIKKYGVGLAAPQVGQPVALALVYIQPTDRRPDVKPAKLTIINPEIVATNGRRAALWEGCLSFGSLQDPPFAKVPRYSRIRLKYLDEQAKPHEKEFEGLMAHVIQHEVDHLNGILFVDRVKDTTTYVTLSEYKKRFREQAQ